MYLVCCLSHDSAVGGRIFLVAKTPRPLEINAKRTTLSLLLIWTPHPPPLRFRRTEEGIFLLPPFTSKQRGPPPPSFTPTTISTAGGGTTLPTPCLPIHLHFDAEDERPLVYPQFRPQDGWPYPPPPFGSISTWRRWLLLQPAIHIDFRYMEEHRIRSSYSPQYLCQKDIRCLPHP